MSNAPASIGPTTPVATVAAALRTGDGTVSLTGQPYGGSGILVAIPEHGAVFESGPLGFNRRAIAEWVAKNATAILSHPAPFYNPRYFGSWNDNGTLYLDIVEAFPREELSQAIAAGIARDQIAIWDNGAQELIETGGTGAIN